MDNNILEVGTSSTLDGKGHTILTPKYKYLLSSVVHTLHYMYLRRRILARLIQLPPRYIDFPGSKGNIHGVSGRC